MSAQIIEFPRKPRRTIDPTNAAAKYQPSGYDSGNNTDVDARLRAFMLKRGLLRGGPDETRR